MARYLELSNESSWSAVLTYVSTLKFSLPCRERPALLDFFRYRRGWSVGSDTPPSAVMAAETPLAQSRSSVAILGILNEEHH
jgi:hypothetical protein